MHPKSQVENSVKEPTTLSKDSKVFIVFLTLNFFLKEAKQEKDWNLQVCLLVHSWNIANTHEHIETYIRGNKNRVYTYFRYNDNIPWHILDEFS